MIEHTAQMAYHKIQLNFQANEHSFKFVLRSMNKNLILSVPYILYENKKKQNYT